MKLFVEIDGQHRGGAVVGQSLEQLGSVRDPKRRVKSPANLPQAFARAQTITSGADCSERSATTLRDSAMYARPCSGQGCVLAFCARFRAARRYLCLPQTCAHCANFAPNQGHKSNACISPASGPPTLWFACAQRPSAARTCTFSNGTRG